ncbi:MAG: hypothetical protein UW73_C0019G0010 [Microgenomates group bacterium GW2011_GWB1_44_8]|nr:MAG: hypothetical protein UW73_C0019G0010 [Microgenomates group bacterium GW2011_GWB1_44_8]
MMGYWRMGYDWPLRMMWWIWPLAVLDLVLRGIALWRAGRAGQKWWFVALLLVNSLGILPGIYLLTHREAKKKKK